MMGILGRKISQKWPKIRTLGTYLLLLVLILFSLRTIVRNRDWQNGLILFSHDVRLSPDAFDLENNLGVELHRVGRYDEAALHFENSVRLAPGWVANWNNLGVAYEIKKDYPKAIDGYQKAIDNGDYYLAYENLGKLYLGLNENQEAIDLLDLAIKKLPQNSKLRFYLAIAYYQKQKYPEAERRALEAYILLPSLENRQLLEGVRSRTLKFKD